MGQEFKLLEVGDKIVRSYRGLFDKEYTIVRVTKTLAITECDSRFKRKFFNDNNILYNSSEYSVYNYSFMTEENREKFQINTQIDSLQKQLLTLRNSLIRVKNINKVKRLTQLNNINISIQQTTDHITQLLNDIENGN